MKTQHWISAALLTAAGCQPLKMGLSLFRFQPMILTTGSNERRHRENLVKCFLVIKARKKRLEENYQLL